MIDSDIESMSVSLLEIFVEAEPWRSYGLRTQMMVVLTVGVWEHQPEAVERQALAGWAAFVDVLLQHAPTYLSSILHQARPPTPRLRPSWDPACSCSPLPAPNPLFSPAGHLLGAICNPTSCNSSCTVESRGSLQCGQPHRQLRTESPSQLPGPLDRASLRLHRRGLCAMVGVRSCFRLPV